MRSIPPELREQAWSLRRQGHSLRAITSTVGLAKSTVQYILTGLRLTPAEARRVRGMQQQAAAECKARLAQARRRERRTVLSEASRARVSAMARELLLRYRPHELAMRARLQALYGDDLSKEAFEGVVMKACSSEHIIDWARARQSVDKLPRRFAVVRSICSDTRDRRKLVAYLPERYLDSQTARKLRKLRVELYALELLEGV